MYVVGQIIGIIAMITFVMSYQMKSRKLIVLVNAMSSVLYVLQYFFLGAFEGAVIDSLATLSAFTASRKNKGFIAKHNAAIIIVSNLCILVAGLSVYKNVLSLLPIAGAILQSCALWMTKEKRIRIVSLPGAMLWMVYNWTCCAYAATVGNFLSICSICFAIFKYDTQSK